MLKYRCKICNYIYDEIKEKELFENLKKDWKCPICNSPKEVFVKINESKEAIAKENQENYKTVSDVLIEQLVAWGVKYIFGIPGTSSLGIVDAVRKNKDIEYFQVRHEQTAAMMASAYGKMTGNIAVCLTIAGPGATNLATGLYDAKLDESPVLAITGYVERKLIGTKAFQEIDQEEFFQPIAVFNKNITHSDEVTRFTTLAIKHALIKKGVSHLSVSADVQKERCDDKIIDINGRIANLSGSVSENTLEKAIELINSSKRPVIVAGSGSLESKKYIEKLAEKISAPVVTSFKGKGIMNEDNPYYVGPHGKVGTSTSHHLTNTTDLLLIIGCSCSNNTSLPGKPAIQIDMNPMVIGKQHPIDISLIGNINEIIPKLIKKVKTSKKSDYLEEIANLKEEWNEILEKEEIQNTTPLKFPYIIKEISKYVNDDALISIDVGENGWRVGRNFSMKNTQELIMSGYLATMGFGLPGALIGQIINPKRQIICITGDGGFSMVMGDFLTAVKYNLPVKIFIFNNQELGMIMAEQKNENYPNWNTHLQNCDFAEFANNCGGIGLKVNDSNQLKIAIKKAFETDKPIIIDITTDSNS